jgi:hypothetical protein
MMWLASGAHSHAPIPLVAKGDSLASRVRARIESAAVMGSHEHLDRRGGHLE